MNVTELHLWSVNIGSGNGLVPSGSKPLPEPMLTQISSHHMELLGHKKLITYVLENWVVIGLDNW